MDMMQRTSVLAFRNYRHFKLAVVLMLIAIAAYIFVPMGIKPHGGMWLQYGLGIVSALIILLLMWYGITKRRVPRVRKLRKPKKKKLRVARSERKQSGDRLQGWLSSHIYLGASLIILATLHTNFQFGWNVHTLAYALMLLVIASGFYGTYVYLKYPRLITLNMGEETLDDLLRKIAELDESARERALKLPAEINELVLNAHRGTRLGGTMWQQLSGKQRKCPTTLAVRQVLQLGSKYMADDQPKLMRDLYSVLLHKEKLVLKARQAIKHQAKLQFWLFIHVPLTIALFAALLAHVVAILFYANVETMLKYLHPYMDAILKYVYPYIETILNYW